MLAPLAFLLAAIVAGVTALSYCQLVVLLPKSAGEATYVEAAFNRSSLTKIVGYLVLFTGIVSAATLINGFLGYLAVFIEIQPVIGVLLIVGIMMTLAIWGIAESLWIVGLLTLLEVFGLILVIVLVGDVLLKIPEHIHSLVIPTSSMALTGLLAGAFLAFYAFIGFEDMVNIVEEVRQPERDMPRAILVALLISTFLYILIALIAVLAMPLDELSASDAPIRDLLHSSHPTAALWVTSISLLAIVNGVLAQMIMGSRVLYGMAAQQRAPTIFSRVGKRNQTPWVATLSVGMLTAVFAILLPLEQLAKATSFIILCVFTLVNLSLWRLKKIRPNELMNMPKNIPSMPIFGATLCMGLLTLQVFSLVL